MRAKLMTAALVVALLVTAACQPDADGPGSQSSAPSVVRPIPAVPLNVVVVIVDDASDIKCSQMRRYLPKTSRLLRTRGTCFDNATVTSPACCPSRAVLQTGQMGHNSGVLRQIDADQLRVEDTIQDDLTNAGYETYGTGKYFNGISPWLFESGERSSGFTTSDFWAGSQYYRFALWDDVAQEPRVPQERIHATTRTGSFLRSFISEQAGSGRPFYAYAAFKAPHTDNSAPNEALRFPVPTPANRNRAVPPFRWNPELDRRDKMSIFRNKLAPRRYYQRLYAARTRAMYDVDDEMGKTFDLLRRQGILDETAIIFTSDNGYHLGENGWETKGDPYQASMNVPLLAYLPGTFPRGRIDKRPVGLIDVAPTLYDLLEVRPGHVVDGHSLLTKRRRTGTYFELQNEKSAALFKEAGYAPGRVPTWAMYRIGVRAYIEYYRKNGSLMRAEFYRDPQFKRNLLWPGFRDQRPSAKQLAHFRKKLRKGRTCAGVAEQRVRNPCP